MLIAGWVAVVGMISALFTADWQFQRPTEIEVEERRVDRPQIGGIAPFLASGTSVTVVDDRNMLEAHTIARESKIVLRN